MGNYPELEVINFEFRLRGKTKLHLFFSRCEKTPASRPPRFTRVRTARPPAMASPAAAAAARAVKIAEYEKFIGERLRPDLLDAELARDKTQREVLQWEALGVNAKTLRTENRGSMRTLVDLGSQVYCQAEVPCTDRVFVNVGLGFHAEMSLVECEAFCEKKLAKLKTDVQTRVEELANVQSHVKLVTEGIRELMQLSDKGGSSSRSNVGGFN